MQIPQQKPSCDIYIPEQDTAHMKKVSIMTKSEPGCICGIARRIGYTGKSRESVAIYRLKVLSDGKLVTLPIPFILESGRFVEYEQWCHSEQREAQ